MVASDVEVISRRAGEASLALVVRRHRRVHDRTQRDGRGTIIRLNLRKGEEEFLEESRLRHIVKTYSDHIALPIVIAAEDGDESINEASALWTCPKKDITDEQYSEFYRHVGGSTSPG